MVTGPSFGATVGKSRWAFKEPGSTSCSWSAPIGPITHQAKDSRLPVWAKNTRPGPSVGLSGSVVGPACLEPSLSLASLACNKKQRGTRPVTRGFTAIVCYLIISDRRRLGNAQSELLTEFASACLGRRHGRLQVFVSGPVRNILYLDENRPWRDEPNATHSLVSRQLRRSKYRFRCKRACRREGAAGTEVLRGSVPSCVVIFLSAGLVWAHCTSVPPSPQWSVGHRWVQPSKKRVFRGMAGEGTRCMDLLTITPPTSPDCNTRIRRLLHRNDQKRNSPSEEPRARLLREEKPSRRTGHGMKQVTSASDVPLSSRAASTTLKQNQAGQASLATSYPAIGRAVVRTSRCYLGEARSS
jgi:hypothetical protein